MPDRIYTIYTQFDQKFMPSQIQLVEFQIRPGMKYWLNWV